MSICNFKIQNEKVAENSKQFRKREKAITSQHGDFTVRKLDFTSEWWINSSF